MSDTEEDIASWIQFSAKLLNYSGSILEFTVVVFLITQQFNSKSPLSSSYFLIFSVGCIVDIMTNVSWVFQGIYYEESVIAKITTNLIMWYGGIFIGTWNTVLAFNRCSALAFQNLHSKLGSGKYLLFTVIFIFVFPLILHSYSFFDFKCRLYTFDDYCRDYIIQTQSVVSVANCCQAIIALALGAYGTLKTEYLRMGKSTTNWDKKTKLQFR